MLDVLCLMCVLHLVLLFHHSYVTFLYPSSPSLVYLVSRVGLVILCKNRVLSVIAGAMGKSAVSWAALAAEPLCIVDVTH